MGVQRIGDTYEAGFAEFERSVEKPHILLLSEGDSPEQSEGLRGVMDFGPCSMPRSIPLSIYLFTKYQGAVNLTKFFDKNTHPIPSCI